MTLTLVATVGSASANAYLDQTAAQRWMDATPNAGAWAAASATPGGARDVALVYATTLLEALAYRGTKVTQEQALQWPRLWVPDPDFGMNANSFVGWAPDPVTYFADTEIPKRVQRGCAALTLEILRAGTADIWGEDPTSNIKRERVDVLETEYVDVAKQKRGLRRYPQVWREIYPLLELSEQPRTERA